MLARLLLPGVLGQRVGVELVAVPLPNNDLRVTNARLVSAGMTVTFAGSVTRAMLGINTAAETGVSEATDAIRRAHKSPETRAMLGINELGAARVTEATDVIAATHATRVMLGANEVGETGLLRATDAIRVAHKMPAIRGLRVTHAIPGYPAVVAEQCPAVMSLPTGGLPNAVTLVTMCDLLLAVPLAMIVDQFRAAMGRSDMPRRRVGHKASSPNARCGKTAHAQPVRPSGVT